MTQPNMPNLPGFDAMAGTLEFVKNMWGGMQTSTGIPGMVMPTLSVEEIKKQITDLKAVESWLNVNMNMLRGTIQALEVQSATISTLHAMGATFGADMKPSITPTSAAPADAPTQKPASGADNNIFGANAAADATTAWWNTLQAQFNQVVNSVMAEEASAAKKSTSAKRPVKSPSATAKKSATKSSAKTAKPAAKKRAPFGKP